MTGGRWAGRGHSLHDGAPLLPRFSLHSLTHPAPSSLLLPNLHRGDAKRLPPEALSLCEVEPLRQEESGSERWVPDDLGVSAFPRLEELRPVPVDSFDRRFDVWVISAPLSEGCGGPELPEEIMI